MATSFLPSHLIFRAYASHTPVVALTYIYLVMITLKKLIYTALTETTDILSKV
jgi:hypothetical protein